jgi:pSer/pThr/pTyr-binding forkhead associated (FHA) protein
VTCKSCGASLDLTMSACPSCGEGVELGRLTGFLGIVCRGCDGYNEPRATTCAACGAPLGARAQPPVQAPISVAERGAPPAPPSPEVSASPPAPVPLVAATAVSPPATPPAAHLGAGALPAPAPGAPVVRSFPKAGGGSATRFVPSVLRPSATRVEPGGGPGLVRRCPRCGAEAAEGRFCSQCGQGLGAHGTQVMMNVAGGAPAPAFAPITPGRVKLVLEAAEGRGEEILRLASDTVEAGRTRGPLTFPDDPCLAPHHATFFLRGGSLHVRDEGAPGGVYLRLRGLSVPLRPGDHFAVGECLLRFAGPIPPPPEASPDGTRRLGSPRPAAPCVAIEESLEGGVTGRVFVRTGPAITIGRAGCVVNLGEDPRLSQAHAEILIDARGGARLKDLGSSNGTYVRIPPHAERELHAGDWIRMGHEVLRVAVD